MDDPPPSPRVSPSPARRVRWAVIVGAVFAVAVIAGVAVVGAFAQKPAEPAIAAVPDAAVDAAPEPDAAAAVVVGAEPAAPCPESTRRERIAEGKKAFGGGDYAAAREAFDKALECHPDDAEALSERGLAWYTTGDLENAAEDLGLASRKTKDRALLGTIWYRRGLVDEKRSKTGQTAFATAYWLSSHEGAKAKVGIPKCNVTVKRLPAVAPVERHVIGGDEELVRKGTNGGALVASLGETGAARRGIDGTAAGGEHPDVVRFSSQLGAEHWLLAKGATSWWAFFLGGGTVACAEESEFELETTRGMLHAHGYAPSGSLGRWMNMDECARESTTGIDAYFDPKREAAIVVARPLPGPFSERDTLPGPTVKMGPDGVTVTGFGCDETVTWADDPDAGKGTLDAGVDASDASAADAGPSR